MGFDFFKRRSADVVTRKQKNQTLIWYQKGYTGQDVDLDTLRPRARAAYVLGTCHVARSLWPLMTTREVVTALATIATINEGICRKS